MLFPMLTYLRYCMDLSPFPGLVLFDIYDTFVNRPPSCDDDVPLR